MSNWKYKTNGETKIETDDYDHLRYCIASDVIWKIKYHCLPTFFIYKDDLLVNLIKGSEFDPLSKFSNEWTKAQQNYIFNIDIDDGCDSLEDKFNLMYQIIEGNHFWSEKYMNKVKEIYEDVHSFNGTLKEYE